MKITVSPINKNDTISKYIENEKLGKVYKNLENKHTGVKNLALERIFIPKNNDNIYRKLNHCFYEIGYKRCRCEEDLNTDIRYRSYLSGNMKDLIFNSSEEAKNWLVNAGAWKE